MKIKTNYMTIFLLFFGSLLFFNGCMAKFDPIAFQQATTLKVESLLLMEKATGSYTRHEGEITALMLKVERAYEYASNKPRNKITANQWKILADPDRNLLGGFMKQWKEKDRLGDVFIEEAKKIITDAFDTIIDLEKGKKK